jgi:hypothetical protein
MADTLLAEDASAEDASLTSEQDEVTQVTPEDQDGKPEEAVAPAEEGAAEEAGSSSEEGQEEPDESAAEADSVNYDALELGEHSALDDAYLDGVKEFAAEHSLDPDVAQAIVSRDEARAEAADKAWADLSAPGGAWETEFVKDPDFGGPNLQRSIRDARAALHKFAPPGFIDDLNNSGYGNHPNLLRLAASVGKAMSESDKIVTGKKTSPDSGPSWFTLFTESGDPPTVRGGST